MHGAGKINLHKTVPWLLQGDTKIFQIINICWNMMNRWIEADQGEPVEGRGGGVTDF